MVSDADGPSEPLRRDPRLREDEAVAVRRREIEQHLVALVTPALVDEHRLAPGGPHSPALARVLAYLRQAPTEGKLAIHAPRAGGMRILRLSGSQGVPHEDLGPAGVDGPCAEDAAAHDVFLRRLRALGADPGAP